MAWNASLQRATFTATGTATFTLPDRTAAVSFVVACAAADLDGHALVIEGSQDGVNYAALPGMSALSTVGALPTFLGKLASVRAVRAAHGASDVVVTLVAEASRDRAMNIPESVTTVTPV